MFFWCVFWLVFWTYFFFAFYWCVFWCAFDVCFDVFFDVYLMCFSNVFGVFLMWFVTCFLMCFWYWACVGLPNNQLCRRANFFKIYGNALIFQFLSAVVYGNSDFTFGLTSQNTIFLPKNISGDANINKIHLLGIYHIFWFSYRIIALPEKNSS